MTKKEVSCLDDTGWKILEELQKNSRISFRELAKKVNLSTTAVLERVKRMEENGIIIGYGAEVDPRKVGYSFSALLNISTDCERPSIVIHELIEDIPEVISSWSVTGSIDHVLEVQLPSLEFLEKVLTRITKIGHVTTQIILPNLSRPHQKRMITAPRDDIPVPLPKPKPKQRPPE